MEPQIKKQSYKKEELEHHIDIDRCKGCGLCVEACPKDVLELTREINVKGYFYARQNPEKTCIMCGMCVQVCPDVAISITPKK